MTSDQKHEARCALESLTQFVIDNTSEDAYEQVRDDAALIRVLIDGPSTPAAEPEPEHGATSLDYALITTLLNGSVLTRTDDHKPDVEGVPTLLHGESFIETNDPDRITINLVLTEGDLYKRQFRLSVEKVVGA